jgi:hypothetical protein
MISRTAIGLKAAIVLGLCLMLWAGMVSLDCVAKKEKPLPVPQEYQAVLEEYALSPALDAMKDVPEASEARDWILSHQVKLRIRDFQAFGPGVGGYDALSWMRRDGGQVIYINKKHITAPPQALASLIAHEAMHNDMYNSVNEEITLWNREADVWLSMREAHPALQTIPEGDYPLVDRLNTIANRKRNGSLNHFVRYNDGYKGLPEHSPGY